ncbi:MAG: hypothetical protein LBF27_32965 [Sphingobacterium sp.]|jgi:hypothetical protein|nr:hypothetical protein [Sphingobacterium sp.]
MKIKKMFFVVCMMLISLTSFGQRVIVDNFEPVPVNNDINTNFKEDYDFGYRLGKTYVLRNDKASYDGLYSSLVESRNNYPDRALEIEAKLLGLSYGWYDNNQYASIGPYKELLHISNVYGNVPRYTYKTWKIVYNGQFIVAVAKDHDI